MTAFSAAVVLTAAADGRRALRFDTVSRHRITFAFNSFVSCSGVLDRVRAKGGVARPTEVVA